MDPRYTSGKYARRKSARKRLIVSPTAIPIDDLDTESSEAESEDYADVYEKFGANLSEQWPPDYWKITKLAGYLQKGSPVLASLALVYISDCDFSDPITMQAVKDNNGINIMINLLQFEDSKVQATSLRCLIKLAKLKLSRYEIVYYGGIETTVGLLWNPDLGIRKQAAELIATLSVFHRAWRIVRECGGIHLLSQLLVVPERILSKLTEKLTPFEMERMEVAIAATQALHVLCKDKKNKKIFWNVGGLNECRKVLKCHHVDFLVAVIKLLQECAVKKYYRTEIRSSEMLVDIRNHLFSEERRLMQISAQVVYRCAADDKSRDFFGEKGFINKIYEILSTAEYHTDEDLMASMTGALWKCAKSPANVKRLQSLNAIQLISQLLATQPLNVQVNIVGCIAECVKVPQICVLARKNGAIDAMVGLLQTTHPELIKNLNNAIAEASKDNESMNIIDRLDAIRLVWSHLKNNDPSVVSNTAWNLCTIMSNMKDSVQYVRTLLGGFELVAEQLKSKYTSVLTPICAVIVSLSKEAENIAILTDFHIVELLSNLMRTKCKRLRYFLCLSIAGCCPFKNNRDEFGELGVVKPLLMFLKSKTDRVRGAACQALYQMSMIPKWCLVIHQTNGALAILLEQLDNTDITVQDTTAGLIQNIRYFSLLRERNVPDYIESRLVEKRRCIS